MNRNGTITATILLCVLLLLLPAMTGCKKSGARKIKKPVPVKFTSEELAEGFVVTRLEGSVTVRLADNIELEPPPYEFFLSLTNPDNQPRQIVFTGNNEADLVIMKGETEIFRHSEMKPGKRIPNPVDIRARGKYSWPLRWNGHLDDGEFPAEGQYDLVFTLNTEPPNSLTFKNVKLKFPQYDEPEEEGESSEEEQPEKVDKPFPFGKFSKT